MDTNGTLEFLYEWDGQAVAREVYKLSVHAVPQTSGIWLFTAGFTFAINELYIFSSAIEALSFLQCHNYLIADNKPLAFASTGLTPNSSQISHLHRLFPLARLKLIFGRDLPGRVADCRVALWWKDQEAYFSYCRNNVYIQFQQANYLIPEARFSLNSFEKKAGLRFGHRTLKPPDKYESYHQLLTNNNLSYE
ncbi:hypothetical protein [Pedobacter sp. SYSU D00535]|uniref:hypothetical protein n=1 Tax=Pedobacter sp. SYSU D00535 TaxID=2810308 RepID=UPI001A966A4B|nr:hypothetical protein [Pedobacter sp. SYSU D00535]